MDSKQLKINDTGVYRQKPDIVTRTIAGETWLIPISGQLADLEQLYHLNETSEVIWKSLNDNQTLSTISQKIVDEYDVAYEEAYQDVNDQMIEFSDAGLIEYVS